MSDNKTIEKIEKNNGWHEWSRYVLKELERLNVNQEEMNEKITNILIEIGMLKVKAGVWGLVGGAIPVIGVGLIWLISKAVGA